MKRPFMKFGVLKKKIRKEVGEAEQALHKAFEPRFSNIFWSYPQS